MEILLTLILGALIGVISALLGLGGNILIVPVLPLLTNIPLPSIIGTGIFIVFFVTFFNVINFYRQKLIDKSLIILLFIPTSLSSYLSSHFADHFSEQSLKVLFILVMAVMLVKLGWSPRKVRSKESVTRNVSLIGAGLFSGALAGLTGVGTGVLLAPLLLSMAVTDEKKVSPTINFLIMVSCFFSSLNYFSFENINYPHAGLVRLDYALYIGIPAILAGAIGRKLNSTISPRKRKTLVGATLSLLMVKMIWGLIG